MPMISKIMPTITMASRIRKATGRLLLSITSSETREMMPEITTVIRKTVTIVLCRCRLAASGSVFATKTFSF